MKRKTLSGIFDKHLHETKADVENKSLHILRKKEGLIINDLADEVLCPRRNNWFRRELEINFDYPASTR